MDLQKVCINIQRGCKIPEKSVKVLVYRGVDTNVLQGICRQLEFGFESITEET